MSVKECAQRAEGPARSSRLGELTSAAATTAHRRTGLSVQPYALLGHKPDVTIRDAREQRGARRGIVSTVLRISAVDELLPIEPTTPPEAESFAA